MIFKKMHITGLNLGIYIIENIHDRQKASSMLFHFFDSSPFSVYLGGTFLDIYHLLFKWKTLRWHWERVSWATFCASYPHQPITTSRHTRGNLMSRILGNYG